MSFHGYLLFRIFIRSSISRISHFLKRLHILKRSCTDVSDDETVNCRMEGMEVNIVYRKAYKFDQDRYEGHRLAE